MEKWKKIKGFEDYQISNLGKVKSFKRTKSIILKPQTTKKGYKLVEFRKDGQRNFFCVHRLVLQAFNPTKSKTKIFVNHKNGIKSDNKLSNLEWCTQEENQEHAFRHNLHGNPRKEVICLETSQIFLSAGDASRYYNCKKLNTVASYIYQKTRLFGKLTFVYLEDL